MGIIFQNDVAYGEGGSKIVKLSKEEYDALTPEQQNDGTIYLVEYDKYGDESKDPIDADSVGGITSKQIATKDYIKYVAKNLKTELVSTLRAGETVITFADDSIVENCNISIFTNSVSAEPLDMIIAEGRIMIFFPSYDESIMVKVVIE